MDRQPASDTTREAVERQMQDRIDASLEDVALFDMVRTLLAGRDALKAEVALHREAAADASLSDGAVRAVVAGLAPVAPEDVAWATAPSLPPGETTAEPWSLAENAPSDGTPFLAYSPALIHPDFCPNGVVEAVSDGEGGFVGAVWDGQHDQWNTQTITFTAWRRQPSYPDGPTGFPPAAPVLGARLRALVEKWVGSAEVCNQRTAEASYPHEFDRNMAARDAFAHCAAELEAVLATVSPRPGEPK